MRGGSYLGVNKGKWRAKSHLSFGVHRVIRTYVQTQVKCIERGDRDDTFWVHSFDQEICTNVWVTLCTLEKDDFFPLPLPSFTPR